MGDDSSKRPWEKGPLEVRVIRTFEGEIDAEAGDDYNISFADYDGGIVEAKLPKEEFRHFPYPIEAGTWFGIVLYQEGKNTKMKVGAWPLMSYWNKELVEASERDERKD